MPGKHIKVTQGQSERPWKLETTALGRLWVLELDHRLGAAQLSGPGLDARGLPEELRRLSLLFERAASALEGAGRAEAPATVPRRQVEARA